MSISITACVSLLLVFRINSVSAVDLGKQVIAAVNCGGPQVIGAHGIQYSEDTLEKGVASDHGMQYSFNNAEPDDMEIYQTERWSPESFEYEVPAGDGEYVVILKFSEVYFQNAGEKVFNVKINSQLAVKNLDIFEAAGGRGFAHDIYIPVIVKGNEISVQGHPTNYDGKIIIEFAKGRHDNPKVNAFAVVRGKVENMPSLPERFVAASHNEEDFDIYETDSKEDLFEPQVIRGDDTEEEIEMFHAASSESENPFEKEDSNMWLGVVVALVVVIPLAYLLQLRFGGVQR